MNNPKISIIVPVYNRAKYITRCLDSILNQSLRDIEILVFDDCSTDNSVEIIQQYLGTNNQLIFIQNKKNIGLGNIRNKGVELAQGKYIMFVDSDDWIASEACEILYEVAENNSLEILIGNRILTNGEEMKISTEVLNKNPTIYDGHAYLINNKLNENVWDKFWLRSFIIMNNIKNTEGRYYEDVQMTYDGLLAANRVAKIDYLFYFSFIGNSDSITRMPRTLKHLYDRQWLISHLRSKIKLYNGTKVEVVLKRLLASVLFPALADIRKYNGEDKEAVRNFLKRINEAKAITGFAMLEVKSVFILKRLFIFIAPIIYLRISRMYDSLKRKNNY